MIQSSVEWQLYQGAFQLIMTTFGSCTVDLFASWLNALLKHFVSWRLDPNTIGTDGLKFPWDKWTAYAFPPFCLIRRCLKIRHGTGSPNISIFKEPKKILAYLWDSENARCLKIKLGIKKFPQGGF